MKVQRVGVAVAIALAALATGCASTPKNTQLGADQWRAAAPLRLDFRVQEPAALLPYEPMGGSATLAGLGSSGNGAVLVLLTLPVWLAVDAGRATAAHGRKQQAIAGNRQLKDSWRHAVNPEQFAPAFERGVIEALPGIALARSDGPDGGAGSGKVLAGVMHFALRSDGRALLAHVFVRLQDVPNDALHCEGFRQCWELRAQLQRPRFSAHFFYHSAVLPEASPSGPARASARSTHGLARILERRERAHATTGSAARGGRAKPVAYVPLWVADDAAPLRAAFADAAASVQRLTRLALANEAPPVRDATTLGHVLFPYLNDGVKFALVREEGARRVLRSRASPVRGVFGTADPAAGHWFDVPGDGDAEPYTAALLDMGSTLKTAYSAGAGD